MRDDLAACRGCLWALLFSAVIWGLLLAVMALAWRIM